ncbi:nitrilase family protein [Alkalihalobacillus oceani]|uniref:nitrilase family protein n=1 Tax=Halalkalibacter oceani TaxID=1653776 RepID=UPI00203BB4A5|nr:nitrilase family protein [Halalkalibacter oceani]MCM3763155.1 nitrilase family protein [Halalkalibacter oceani]
MNHKENLVNIACIQMEPVFGDIPGNTRKSIELINQASNKGANIIVLPELCNSGYVFNSRIEALSLAEEIPSGPTVQSWIRVAKENDVYIVAGINEKEGDKLYNSAVLIGPEGYIGTYRKNHLWNEEKYYFEEGNLGFPVFETKYGKLGILVCYDIWFPEAFRVYAKHGVDLVCVATNWVPMAYQPKEEKRMAVHIAQANAHMNSVFVACADRVGVERGQPFIGSSVIVDSDGWCVTGPASYDEEELLLATCDLSKARRGKQKTKLNSIMDDRREEIYQVEQKIH